MSIQQMFLGATVGHTPQLVAFDANATAPTANSFTASLTNGNLTVGTGLNRALVVQLTFNSAVSAITVKWNATGANQSLTLIQSATSGSYTATLWGLVSPVSGNKIISAAWTSSTFAVLNGVSWTGVDPTGGTTSFPNATYQTGSSTSPSVTITSQTNNATIDCVCAQAALSAPAKTQTFNYTAAPYDGGSRAAGASSNTHGWTQSSGGLWASVGCDIMQYF